IFISQDFGRFRALSSKHIARELRFLIALNVTQTSASLTGFRVDIWRTHGQVSCGYYLNISSNTAANGRGSDSRSTKPIMKVPLRLLLLLSALVHFEQVKYRQS